MPEIKNHFRAGKINKDLDERLIQKGEYRDALNLEIASSQGDDVGSLQTVAGNRIIADLNIPGAECIGSYVDHINDKVYWFVTGTLIDAIIEYDPKQNTILPVLVDAPATEADAILNFSTSFYICGINTIDGLLFWTDGQTEPKMINISRFKSGSVNYSTTTTLYNIDGISGNFSLEDVTVIKKNPVTAPTITFSNTKRDGVVEGIFTAMGGPIVNNSFTTTDSFGDIVPVETTIAPFNITILGSQVMDWRVGDQLKATATGTGNAGLTAEEVRLRVVQTYSTSPMVFKVSIDAISEEIEQGQQNWNIVLVEDKPMFEFKFPRFAYRWKLKDGQYSAIGPYSEVAFSPDEFDYQAKKGYNLGMTNNIRSLKISDFVTADIPKDCVEIDILYKESNNTNVYTVKSIKSEYGDVDPEYTADELEITSEIIHAVIPANQSLRPWDNVPVAARAQEITGNRLVYGNYQSGYDMKDSNYQNVSVKFEVVIGGSTAVTPRFPGKSIKTLRTYQVGIVYRDAFGRETPVFTDANTGSVILDKSQAALYNNIKIKVISPPPAWATSYKYFIKETSNEYYNVAMDRHYEAEDGNAWISFPSSERNKVHEDRFLILKKGHNDDAAIVDEARYKVLAVSNDVPDYIRIQDVSQGVLPSRTDNGQLFLAIGYPSSNTGHFSIDSTEWEARFGSADPTYNNTNVQQMALHTQSNLVCRIFSGTRETDKYDVANISFLGSGTSGNYAGGQSAGSSGAYKIEIKGIFKEADADWLGSVTESTTLQGLSVEFYQKQTVRKPEYQGRFFAKLNKDSILESAILSKANEENYKIIQSLELWQHHDTSKDMDWWRNTSKGNNTEQGGWYIDRTKVDKNKDAGGTGTMRKNWANNGSANTTGVGWRAGENKVEIAYHWWKGNDRNAWQKRWNDFETTERPQFAPIVKAFQTPGALLRLTDDPNATVYTIKRWRRNHCVAYDRNAIATGKFGSMRVIRWTLDLDQPVGWAPEDENSTINGTNFAEFGDKGSTGRKSLAIKTPLEILEQFSDDELDAERSKNPAIFETEPLEDIGLDLYNEASNAYTVSSSHGSQQTLGWFNCYSFGNGVESNRIRDDFNAVMIDKGPKVSTVLAEPYAREYKTNGLIFSGLYNSNSSVNQLNQFIMAEAITKDIDPSYGSIQKLHARDTNLITLCQDKCIRILCDKDALFNADGSANLVASNRFLGQSTPYVGEFGISSNPESFAAYGYQAYFTDKSRGAVIRLSRDGITPISDHGTVDYFSDKLNTASSDKIIGSYDENRKLYNLTIKDSSQVSDLHRDFGDTTISFSEKVTGWTSRKSFIPESGASLNNTYYTFKGGDMYEHGVVTYGVDLMSTFYGTFTEPMIKFIFNDQPASVKTFRTLNYEGTQAYWKATLNDNEYYNNQSLQGWYNKSITTDLQEGVVTEFKDKENKWFNFIEGVSTTGVKSIDTNEFAVQGIGQGTVTSDTGGFTEITLTITENAD